MLAFIAGGMSYIFIKPVVNDLRLAHNGVCTRAKLIAETTRVRYRPAELKYQFTLPGGKQYQGKSTETDLNKIGDPICVLYLPDNPTVNKPASHFADNKDVHCSCQ